MTRLNGMRRMSFGLVVLVAMLVGGCGDDGAGGSGNGWPADRTFYSTSVTGRALVPGTRIELRFFRDGRLDAQAGCNHIGGNGSIDNGTLAMDDLGTTEMGCDEPRHAQDQWLATFLGRKPQFSLSGDQLVLTGGEVKIELVDRKVADPDRSLYGVRWQLETIVTGDAASSVPSGASATVEFTADGKFTASAGCNAIGGTAKAAGTSITFAGVAITKKACEEPQQTVETALVRVLRDTVEYKIDGPMLTLTHPSGAGLQLRAPS